MNRRGLLYGLIVAPLVPFTNLIPEQPLKILPLSRTWNLKRWYFPQKWHAVKWETWMTDLPEGYSSLEIIKIEDGSITVGKWKPDESNSKS